MKLLLKLGWRNIFRNKRRTLLTSLVIGIGLASLMLQDALMIGMMDHIIERATGTFMGQAQIHAPGFRQGYDVEDTIHNIDDVVADLQSHPEVSAFAVRAISPSTLSSARNMVSVNLYGVDPAQEQHVSKLKQGITAGEYFDIDDKHAILIGDELAELLEVRLGERIVATVAEAHTGELSQVLFRVSGIFRLGEKPYDKASAFIALPTAQSLLGIGDSAHEIAIQFHRASTLKDPLLPAWKTVEGYGNEVLGWQELIPSIRVLLDYVDIGAWVVGAILFSLVLLIIMNTLFMAIFERMTEFGILRAIGTRSRRLMALIVVEAGAMAVLSIVAGLMIGVAMTVVFGFLGFDYSGIDIGGVTMAEPIYTVLHWKQVTVFPLVIFVFVLVAALYPAMSAARITPAKAMVPHD